MKLLDIAPYPWLTPMHGGQHRVYNIVSQYRKLGVELETIGIIPPGYPENQRGFLTIERDLLDDFDKIPLQMLDYYVGEQFAFNERLYATLKKQIRSEPDIIQVEQPWLFKFAYNYSKEIKKKVKLVYSSHNIEHLLKQKILLSTPFDASKISYEIEKIRNLEEFAIKRSDVVICCTERDERYAKSLNENVVTLLCPNGVRPIDNTLTLNVDLPEKFAIFCASGHPPNTDGLYEIFKKGIGCLSPDQRLIIVGSVCDVINIDPRFDSIPNFKKRTVLLGKVNEKLLDFLLAKAHVIILPIVYGEGSNLKTAESLYAGKWIVATECALRGFEEFKESKGVLFAETSQEFVLLMRKAFTFETLHLPPEEWEKRKKLLWENTLSRLQDLVK